MEGRKTHTWANTTELQMTGIMKPTVRLVRFMLWTWKNSSALFLL